MESGTIVIRFPDGSKEFRFSERMLEEGDIIWHEGKRYRVLHVLNDERDQPVARVEPDSGDILDSFQSEAGEMHLMPGT